MGAGDVTLFGPYATPALLAAGITTNYITYDTKFWIVPGSNCRQYYLIRQEVS